MYVRVGVRRGLKGGERLLSYSDIGLRLRLRLGGGVGGSDPVAGPDSVHDTCIEVQLLMPQHHIHIRPRPLLFRRYKPTETELTGSGLG